MEKKYRLEFILFITFVLLFGFVSGMIFANEFLSKMNNKLYVGCWQSIKNSERNILIRVDNRELSEIEDTARHEICHEIYYRLNNKTTPRDENERFAETCNISDYLYLDKR